MMLADNIEGYKKQEEHLKFDFKKLFGLEHFDKALNGAGGDLVDWVERLHPRKCVITLLLFFSLGYISCCFSHAYCLLYNRHPRNLASQFHLQ